MDAQVHEELVVDNLSFKESAFAQRLGHLRGLAAATAAGDDGHPPLLDGLQQGFLVLVDGQLGLLLPPLLQPGRAGPGLLLPHL